MTEASTDPAPVAVAFILTAPPSPVLSVPARTGSPGPLGAGIGSPASGRKISNAQNLHAMPWQARHKTSRNATSWYCSSCDRKRSTICRSHTPVREDSSAAVRPSRTTPSTGIRSPGRTSTVSPSSAPAANSPERKFGVMILRTAHRGILGPAAPEHPLPRLLFSRASLAYIGRSVQVQE